MTRQTSATATRQTVRTKRRSSKTTRAAPAEPARTKGERVIALVSRSQGATLDEMMKETGWQAHSVRGFLAGTLKKKLGRPVVTEVTSRGRTYRVLPEAS